MTEAIYAIVALLFGFFFGWVFAHETVAKECTKLGAFYVSSNVYECKEKSK